MSGYGYYSNQGTGANGWGWTSSAGSFTGYLHVPNQGTQWVNSHNPWR